jgi:hypothetical protein
MDVVGVTDGVTDGVNDGVMDVVGVGVTDGVMVGVGVDAHALPQGGEFGETIPTPPET